MNTADDPADARRLLEIYLHDHRAGASGGAALATRMAGRYADEPGYEALARLVIEIEADQDALDELRAELGVTGGGVRRALALVGERIGRLKPNHRLRRRSPLSRLEELEMLSAGIHAKGRLWSALDAVMTPDAVDLRRLRGRAETQLAVIDDIHERAAIAALGGAAAGALAPSGDSSATRLADGR